MDKSCLNSYTKKHHIESSINDSNLFYMGFELELVESPDGVSTNELEELVSLATDSNLLAKYDGSVDAELVSRPLLRDDLKEKIKETLAIVSKSSANWVSWDQSSEYSAGGRCGFHLHVNKRPIKNIKALYRFINRYEDFFKVFSGRKNLYYCRVDPYYMANNYNKRHNYRYSAINNLNAYTVEFRLWRGSLNFQRLCFYVDLTYTLCKYSHALNRMTLEDVLFLTNNNFVFNFLDDDHAIWPSYDTSKEIKAMQRLCRMKHNKIGMRFLNYYHSLDNKHLERWRARYERQQEEETTQQQPDNNQVACF